VVNEAGLPEALHFERGNCHDVKATGSIMAQIPKGAIVLADKGYDSKGFRRQLRYRKLKPMIPKRQFKNKPKVRCPKPKLYQKRWTIERTFAWLEKFRKLVLRYEYKINNWKGFWYLGCSILHLDKLIG
jgi:IS5 family transposase